jgi:hypothetical protein
MQADCLRQPFPTLPGSLDEREDSMGKPKVYADFHNVDSQGRLRLNCIGTIEDLSHQQVELREGLVLALYSDDLDDQGQPDELLVDGVVSFSAEEHCWVATIDWAAIRHASDKQDSDGNGDNKSSPVQPASPAQLGAPSDRDCIPDP